MQNEYFYKILLYVNRRKSKNRGLQSVKSLYAINENNKNTNKFYKIL